MSVTDEIRKDIKRWQESQGERFNKAILSIVSEYAEWRDKNEAALQPAQDDLTDAQWEKAMAITPKPNGPLTPVSEDGFKLARDAGIVGELERIMHSARMTQQPNVPMSLLCRILSALRAQQGEVVGWQWEQEGPITGMWTGKFADTPPDHESPCVRNIRPLHTHPAPDNALVEAAKPIAELADQAEQAAIEDPMMANGVQDDDFVTVKIGQCRAVRSALAAQGDR